jgi:hypothetical protein
LRWKRSEDEALEVDGIQHSKRGKSQFLNDMRQNEKIESAFSLNETPLRVVHQVLMKTV